MDIFDILEQHYDSLLPDASINVNGCDPVNDPAISKHKHIMIEWEGGTIWLDMSVQTDHYCIDIRQFNPDGEMKGQGAMTIVNGHRMQFKPGNPEYESLPDTNGDLVFGHNWPGGYVTTLMTDLHGKERSAIEPSDGNG